MKISRSERETLCGPLAAGVVTGIFAAACAIAFDSEYHRAPLSDWPMMLDAAQNFFIGFCVAFIPFGVAPVLIGLLSARK